MMKGEKNMRVPYENADTAKPKLMELLYRAQEAGKTQKEIDQLSTIIGKPEAWQNKYAYEN